MTTLRDIAEKAGVSSATVSRVLNHSTLVTADVTQTVRAAMRQLGYQARVRRPGRKTEGRKGLRTGSILFLFAGFGPSDDTGRRGYPSLMRGVERAVHEAGLKLMIAALESDGEMPVALDAREVDGILLFLYRDPASLSATARARLDGIPTVSLMRSYDALRDTFDQVLFNNARIGPMAADYLIGRQHRQLAYVNELPSHPVFAARLRDFSARAKASGVPVLPLIGSRDPANFREEVEAGEGLVERLLAARPKATGAFVAADYQVPQFYMALERRGVRPGRDIEIIGCDNAPFFLDRLAPRPATIDINLELVGRRGVQQLLWRIAHREVVNRVRVVLEPALVPGDGHFGGPGSRARKQTGEGTCTART